MPPGQVEILTNSEVKPHFRVDDLVQHGGHKRQSRLGRLPRKRGHTGWSSGAYCVDDNSNATAYMR